VIVCTRCGRESPDQERFCASCGAALTPVVGREERKAVTVVFADLVGSTAAAELSDPEDVRAMLAAHHARVRAELVRYGGTVEKFIGDAVVAVFGAPVVHEDDPERAVRAALAIRDTAVEAAVELRVAVNTGEALVSLDASPAVGEGMVAGDVVNTAARIQSAAPVNGVLVGETTYRATAHVIEYREADPIAAKGKALPVVVWEAIAPRARFGSDVERTPLVALVGRDREVDQLRDALTRCREERMPQLVTVAGVPGIGKSRLAAELLQIVDELPELITWRQGRCLPYGEGISYWALSEMAKAHAGVLEDDSASEASRKLTEAVTALVADPAEAGWVTEHLKPLLGLTSNAGSAGESRGEAFAAWRRFFEALGEQRPTVLVFEDLHWADDGLLEFVDGLVDRATGVPLLILCTARPELLARRPHWGGGKANTVTLSLSALSDEDTARLIADHLSQAVLPAELQQTLLRRADGNPLFAEEYVRMLKDRGLLRRDGQTWRLDAVDVDVPETVQGIIAARLDALHAEEKEALQAASVVGKVFWLSAVAKILGLSAWEAEERLHALERKEVVRRERHSSVAGDADYAVRHALVRDVAYGQIPRARRADLHVRACEWIESLGEDRSEDRAELLAHHYLAALDLARAAGRDTGELATRASRALREAGQRAYSLSSLETAASFFRQALELWSPDDPDYAQVLFELGNALFEARNEGVEQLQEAARRLLAAGDREGAAKAESKLAHRAWFTGAHQLARSHSRRSVELIAGLSDTQSTAAIRSYAWRLQLLQGERPSIEEGRRILALTEELGTAEDILNSRITLAMSLSSLDGDLAATLRELESALEDALQANSWVAARAYNNLASYSVLAGDLRRSAELARAGIETARRYTSRLERWLEAELIVSDFYAGDWDRAIEAAEAFVEDPGPAEYMDCAMHAVLAEAAAARGDRPAMDDHAATLIRRAREIGDPQALQAALAICAWLAHDTGDDVAARAFVHELIRMLSADISNFGPDMVEGAVTAELLGLDGEFGAALANIVGSNPWLEVCISIIDGRLEEAGEMLHAREAYPQAALVRMLAAERAGRETPGLADAVVFYEGVSASAYRARAERLLQASA
jgi:predicted ATPase/class 3 adenylate cyclase